MIDPLQASVQIASSGLEAQSTRLRVVSENLANANSTGRTPGAEPYRRKTTTFTGKSVLYSDEFFGGVSTVEIDFKVIYSGMTRDEAKGGEAVLSESLVGQYGRERVLTSPRGRKD